jgi:hypothetical protein
MNEYFIYPSRKRKLYHFDLQPSESVDLSQDSKA